MEKSSKIPMTKNDWELFREGKVSDRLKTQYGINTYEELCKIIDFLQTENIE